MLNTFPIFTAFILGLLTILDPCTLMTSITAIGFIDREISNKRRVLSNGLMFVTGKLVTYILLSIPFMMGAQTSGLQHLLDEWGEPILAGFLLICGVLLLFAGHHHHNHDHGMSKWLQAVDNQSSGFWSFMLGIFFAIAFCPHRLIYFITMIDITLTLPMSWGWMMPIVFGLATGLPIMIIAWLISYSAVEIANLTNRMSSFEKWFRYICSILFLSAGVYMGIHSYHHEHAHEHGCSCECHESGCTQHHDHDACGHEGCQHEHHHE